jgi:putative membrane protein
VKLLTRLLFVLFALAVLALGVLFAVENTATVPLNLLIIQLSERSIALWVLVAFALGGVLGMLTNIGVVWRLRTAMLRARRQLQSQASDNA